MVSEQKEGRKREGGRTHSNEASGVDEDAAVDAGELREGVVSNSAPAEGGQRDWVRSESEGKESVGNSRLGKRLPAHEALSRLGDGLDAPCSARLLGVEDVELRNDPCQHFSLSLSEKSNSWRETCALTGLSASATPSSFSTSNRCSFQGANVSNTRIFPEGWWECRSAKAFWMMERAGNQASARYESLERNSDPVRAEAVTNLACKQQQERQSLTRARWEKKRAEENGRRRETRRVRTHIKDLVARRLVPPGVQASDSRAKIRPRLVSCGLA